MAVLYGAYTGPRSSNPQGLVDGGLQGGHVRLYREKISLAGQTIADTIVVAFPSTGETFIGGVLSSDVSLGTAQISIGVAGATAKYKTLAPHTAIDVPVLFGKTSAQIAKLTADEVVFITIATASLPVAGTLIVDLYFAQT